METNHVMSQLNSSKAAKLPKRLLIRLVLWLLGALKVDYREECADYRSKLDDLNTEYNLKWDALWADYYLKVYDYRLNHNVINADYRSNLSVLDSDLNSKVYTIDAEYLVKFDVIRSEYANSLRKVVPNEFYKY